MASKTAASTAPQRSGRHPKWKTTYRSPNASGKQQDDKEQEGILGERMEQLLLGQKTTHRTATDPERSNRRCSIHLKHRNDALKNTQDGN